jgi:two-component system, LytTR family, sensor kinase
VAALMVAAGVFKTTIMFTHKYRYLFALLLSAYTYLNTEFCRVYFHFDIRIAWYAAFGAILLITFGILEANRLIEPIIRRRVRPENFKLRFPVIFLITGSVVSTLLTAGIVLFMGMVLHSFSLEENYTPLKLNLMYGWLVNLLYHLINTIIFFFREYQQKMLEAEELKRITIQAELQVVKSQINPHFLFNNLNVLSALVLKNNEDANKFIEEFSKVYRYILTNHDKELVELQTELDFIQPYIFLLQKRFAEGLVINISIAEKYKEQLIIPAGLQMLIENAIKHNVVSRNKPLVIDVHTNGNNTIVVSNNLQPKQTVENSTGIGLQNIIKRCRLVSNREVQINHGEKQFIVALPLINLN